jgi:formylmethanofuran dehydrogenase subunit E
MSKTVTVVRCSRCGVFIEFGSKDWVLKKGKPMCFMCVDHERKDESNDRGKEGRKKNNVG